MVSEAYCQVCLDLVEGRRTKEEVQSLLLTGNEHDVESRLWKTWSGIVSAAERVEVTQQGALVELLEDLKGHPVCIQARKEKIWGNDYAEDQLPIFGAYMREALDIAQTDLQKYSRFCSFSAQVTEAGVEDLLLHGLWIIREALEDVRLVNFADKQTEMLLAMSGACQWLTHAHKAMYDSCKAGRQFEGRLARRGEAIDAQELPSDGLTMQRWELWKAKAETISKQERISDEMISYTRSIISILSSSS